MTRRNVFITIIVFCVFLCAFFFFSWFCWIRKPNLAYEKQLQFYPILRRTGQTLPELLKLGDKEEVWQLCTGDPKYTLRNYVTNEAETLLAENSLKQLFVETESIHFHISRLYHPERVYEVKNASLNIRFADAVRFRSGVHLWPPGGPNLLWEKSVQLQPSGLTIIWWSLDGESKNYQIHMHDSKHLTPYWCDVQACPSFVDLLENSLIKIEEEGTLSEH